MVTSRAEQLLEAAKGANWQPAAPLGPGVSGYVDSLLGYLQVGAGWGCAAVDLEPGCGGGCVDVNCRTQGWSTGLVVGLSWCLLGCSRGTSASLE
jgi:hypothetical protein